MSVMEIVLASKDNIRVLKPSPANKISANLVSYSCLLRSTMTADEKPLLESEEDDENATGIDKEWEEGIDNEWEEGVCVE